MSADAGSTDAATPVPSLGSGSGPRRFPEWVAVLLLAGFLTMSAAVIMVGLRFGVSFQSENFGAFGLIATVPAVTFALGVGLVSSRLTMVPLLQHGFGDVPPGSSALTFPPRRPRPPRRLTWTVYGMVLVDVAAMWELALILPFRPGLLSCLYYCLPAVLLACLATPPRRSRLLLFCVVLTAGAALALPVRALQIHVAAQQWLGGSGVAERAQAQVVVIPGLDQSQYYMFDGKTLAADFSYPMQGMAVDTAAETVTPGSINPCGPILDGDGDGDEVDSASCTRVDADLWLRGGGSEFDDTTGFVLERDGVTITLATGSVTGMDLVALRQEVLAAHPASDDELWTREGSTKHSLIGLLLL